VAKVRNTRPCQNCHGRGTVQREVIEKGRSRWVTETCFACRGRGVIDVGAI
jgi:DnaJ-class molecular chaperone